MDEFDFEPSDRTCKNHKIISSVTGNDESYETSSTTQGHKKRHRLNHRSLALSYQGNNLNSVDKGKEIIHENTERRERVSQSSDSVSTSTSWQHTHSNNDGKSMAGSSNGSPRQMRRRKKPRCLIKETKRNISHEYFSSMSPIDFSSSSSLSSGIPLATSKSFVASSNDHKSDGTVHSYYDSSRRKGNDSQIEILSGDKFGTPPGSPPTRRRRKTLKEELDEDEFVSSLSHRNGDNMSVGSSSRSVSFKSDSSHRIGGSTESPSCSPKVNKKSSVSGEYSVASEASNITSRSYGSGRISHRRDNYSRSSQASYSNTSVMSSCGSERVMTGAGTDIYAMQDAGSSRLLIDECNFICTSFLTSMGTKHDSGVNQKKYNFIVADAACDLANILAVPSSRNILLLDTLVAKLKVEKESAAQDESSSFETILSLFAHVPSSNRGSCLPSSTDFIHDDGPNQDSGTIMIDWKDVCSPPRTHRQVKENNEGRCASAAMPRTKSARSAVRSKQTCSESESSEYECIVVQALAIAACYVSLQCKWDKASSLTNSRFSAITFQRKLLRNGKFMNGLASLLLCDNVVSSFLESTYGTCYKSESANEESACAVNSDDSADDPLDSCRVSRMDPTTRGRRKKRRLQYPGTVSALETIQEDTTKENECQFVPDAPCFEFSSDDTSNSTNPKVDRNTIPGRGTRRVLSRLQQKINKAYSKLANETSVIHDESKENCLLCGLLPTSSSDKQAKLVCNPGKLALDAIHIVLTGKHGNEGSESNEMDEVDDKHDASFEEEKIYSDDEFEDREDDIVEKSNLNNPMIYKNFMMRRSGAIPYFVRATTETLEACVVMSSPVMDSEELIRCIGCREYLKDRVLRLLSLIDGLCCLSKSNREVICLISRKDHDRTVPLLIPSLLRIAAQFSGLFWQHNSPMFSDVGLAALRTLTSLTHENASASFQFSYFSVKVGDHQSRCSGIEIILNLLYNLVQTQSIHSDTNHVFDGIIFCLNSLTNLMESTSFHVLSKMVLDTTLRSNCNDQECVPALSWISRWIVEQTEPFRDAVMSGTFGESSHEEGNRDLEHHEDEFLITAGNGFILLACLLGAHNSPDCCPQSSTKRMIQSIILGSMPPHENKFLLMINTLKAFCNYYRYSVGDLSVAIVTPVLQLISGLEKMSRA